jgi:hypothetical protein
MTIYNPRVGLEVIFVAGGGTSDPADATVVDIHVGSSIVMVSPPAGWSAGSGQPPGGIVFNGASAGDKIALRAGDVAQAGFNVRIYLQPGDSLFDNGATSFGINGGPTSMTKINATQWVFDR